MKLVSVNKTENNYRRHILKSIRVIQVNQVSKKVSGVPEI